MIEISEKAAYLKGLMEGMKLDPDNREHKLIAGIIDVLGDLAEAVKELQDGAADLDEFTEDLGADVDELFERVEDVEDALDPDGSEKVGCRHECQLENDESIEFTEFKCPKCGGALELSEVDDPSDVVCPKCGEHIDLTDELTEDTDN